MSDQPPMFVFGRPPTTGLVGKRDLGEQVVLAAGAGVGLLCLLVVPSVPLKVCALVVVLAATLGIVFVPYRPRGLSSRRTLYRWWEINRHYRRTLRAGSRWRSTAKEAGFVLDGECRPVTPPPGIAPMGWLTTSVRGSEVAVLLHPARRLMTVTMEVESDGMSGLDLEEQVAALDRWQILLDHYGNGHSHLDRLQVVARQIRADASAHQRFVVEHRRPDAPDWMRNSYETLASAVSTSAEQHRYYVVAGFRYTRDFAADAALLAPGDAGTAALLAAAIEDLWERLSETELHVVDVLGVGQLTALIRNCYEPDRSLDDVTISRNQMWPAEVDARHGRYLTVSGAESEWFHATAWISCWPFTPVGINFLAPLLVGIPDVIRTTSVTLRLESNDKAVARMLSDVTNEAAEAARNRKRGRVEDPRDQRLLAATHERGEELARGHAGVALVGYVTVSAPTAAGLERAQKTLSSQASRARCRVEWCDREHDRAFAVTLPMAGGVQ